MPNVPATLYLNGVPVSTTLTNDVGYYQFIELTPGVPYSVSFQLPNGYEWTLIDIGDDAEDSDVDSGGNTPVVTLPRNTFNPTLDAGIWTAPTAAISKTSLSPGATSAGEVITYQIVVRNTGVTLAQSVIITDPIPQSTTYVAGSAIPSALLINGSLVWPEFSLAPGASFTVTFAVLVDSQLVGVTVITNVAQTRFDGYPIVLSSNRVIHPLGPTAITLDAFSAEMNQGGVLVRWRTSLERSTLGFNVLRSNTGDRADATRVNAALIAAAGPNGGAYDIVDANGIPGAAYWIEEIDLNGATHLYGPAQVASLSGGPAPNTTVSQLGGQAIAPQPGAALVIAGGAAQVVPANGQSIVPGSAASVAPATQPGLAPQPGPQRVSEPQPTIIAPDSVSAPASDPEAAHAQAPTSQLGARELTSSTGAQQRPTAMAAPTPVAAITDQQRSGVVRGASEPSQPGPISAASAAPEPTTQPAPIDARPWLLGAAIGVLTLAGLALGGGFAVFAWQRRRRRRD